MRLAAEPAQVHAAHLAAALRASLSAQVAPQGAVRHQGLQENLVQRQVVRAKPAGSGRGDVHLGVAGGTQHRDGGQLLPRRAAHRERLQLADAFGAEGVQTGEDFGVPVQALAYTTHRPGLRRGSASLQLRAQLGSQPLRLRHLALLKLFRRTKQQIT